MRVLVACECSGVVRRALEARGHTAWSVDLQPNDDGFDPMHVTMDVMEYLRAFRSFDLMIAHPPCTYLTNCDASNWKKMKGSYNILRYAKRSSAAKFFLDLYNMDIPRICIENPVGIMNNRWRKPDQIIQPFMFGHPITKRTCFWLKNLPPLMPTKIVDVPYGKDGDRVGLALSTVALKPKERAKVRSRTFEGIADAMAEQWGNL